MLVINVRFPLSHPTHPSCSRILEESIAIFDRFDASLCHRNAGWFLRAFSNGSMNPSDESEVLEALDFVFIVEWMLGVTSTRKIKCRFETENPLSGSRISVQAFDGSFSSGQESVAVFLRYGALPSPTQFP